MDNEPLDFFGAFLVGKLRDPALRCFDTLSGKGYKASAVRDLQSGLASLPSDHQDICRRAIVECIDSAIHDFLFALKEQADFENRITISVDGLDIVAASDGLHGEPYGPEGWFSKYSQYGAHPDVA